MPRLSHTLKALIPLSVLFLSTLANAKDYVVDLVIFESTAAVGEAHYTDNLYYPIASNTITLGSQKANNAGFTLSEPSSESNAIVAKLRSSGRYNVIKQLSWVQPGLAENEARAIRLAYKSPVTLYLPADTNANKGLIKAVKPGTTVDSKQIQPVESHLFSGTIKVSLGKYLHLDTNLVLINDEGTSSTKMQLHRRMRSMETHYLDNPRFGLIVHFTPIEAEAEPAQQ